MSIELMIRVGLRSFTLSESLKKGENRCHNVTAVMYTLNDWESNSQDTDDPCKDTTDNFD